MRAILLILAGALAAATATAGEHRFTASTSAWKAECGSCHTAYPPQFLPADAWRRLLARLQRHFGTDVSLDAKTAAEIERFHFAHAGTRREGAGGDDPRITETAWFRKEHRKVPAAAWKHVAVKSAANCSGCHTQAEQGDFSERALRLPK